MRHLPPISNTVTLMRKPSNDIVTQGLVEGLCRLGTTITASRGTVLTPWRMLSVLATAIIESVLSSLKDYEYDPNVLDRQD